MSEWWTYTLSDFLMFAPRTYYRLFELYNAEVWPLQLVTLALGAVVVGLVWRDTRASGPIVCMILAAVWLFVAWAYHWRRFAVINWGAEYYAVGFALQALLLIAFGALDRIRFPRRSGVPDTIASVLLAVGLLYSLIALLAGRTLSQSEVFGIAPDPTAIATLGALLLASGRARWMPMVLPILWCAISAATLWTMDSVEALIPAAMIIAVFAAEWRSHRHAAASNREKANQLSL